MASPEEEHVFRHSIYDAPYMFSESVNNLVPGIEERQALETFLTTNSLVSRAVHSMSDLNSQSTVFEQTLGAYTGLYRKWLGQNIESDRAVWLVNDEADELADKFNTGVTYDHEPQYAAMIALERFFNGHILTMQPAVNMDQLTKYRTLVTFTAFGEVAYRQLKILLEQGKDTAGLILQMSQDYLSGAFRLTGPVFDDEIREVSASAVKRAELFLRENGLS